MKHPIKTCLPLLVVALCGLLPPSVATAGTPGYMACVVNRTGENRRFFYTKVFQRDLESRAATATELEDRVYTWSSGRYKLEANCIWHEIRSVVANKIADIVNDVENAGVDTYDMGGPKGTP